MDFDVSGAMHFARSYKNAQLNVLHCIGGSFQYMEGTMGNQRILQCVACGIMVAGQASKYQSNASASM